MRRNGLAILASVVAVVVALASIAAVSGQPPLPIIYSGQVTIEGAPAPEGLTVVGCVQSCDRYESEPVITGSGWEYRLLVVGPSDEFLVNEVTTFWIVTPSGRIRATQAPTFRAPANPSGLTPTLNLEFADPVPTPPPPTFTSTPEPTPTPTVSPFPPTPGDASVGQLSWIVLIAGLAALALGGAILVVS